MKEKVVVNARRINKMRFISGIVICSLVIVVTFVSMALNFVDFFRTETPESGLGSLRMFTNLSNIVAAVAASMCLPFQIDGLRRNRYNLPSWIIMVMYVGAVGTFLTFSVAITLISAYQGFVKTMFGNSNLLLHTINPLLITALFVLVVPDTRIRFSRSFISLVPIALYMILYFIMVFVAKVWRDHYHTNDIIPWPVSLVLMIAVSFGISQLLRFLHNLSNKHLEKSIEKYYKESPDFDFPKVSDAIGHLAKIECKFYYEGDDIVIPVDTINMLSDRYKTNKIPVDILYDIYLEYYLIGIGKSSEPNSMAVYSKPNG